MKRRRKCVAWSKSALWCDGCKQQSTKCPMRDKYRVRRKKMNDRYRQKLKYRKRHPAEIIVICGEHVYRWGSDGVFEEIEL